MKKSAKPVKISEGKEWKNPSIGKSIFYHQIEMDNGDKGQFNTNVSPQVKFTIGEQVDYTYEQDKNKDGTDKVDKFNVPVMKIDKFKEPFQAGGFKKQMSSPHEMRSIAACVCLECAELLLTEKENITSEIIRKCSDKLYMYLISDNIIYNQECEKWGSPESQLAIQKQSALKRAATSCRLLKKTTADELIALSNEYFNYIKNKSNM